MSSGRIEPRTGMEVLDPGECWRLVERQSVGRLAVSIANRPDIFPVNHVVIDRRIAINTRPGTKLAAAVLGTSVAYEVDALDHDNKLGWSVVVQGVAHEVTDDDEIDEIEKAGLEPWSDHRKTRYLRIDPDSITGRRLPDA